MYTTKYNFYLKVITVIPYETKLIILNTILLRSKGSEANDHTEGISNKTQARMPCKIPTL